MAISKKFLKSKPVCKVRFEVPKDQVENGDAIYLVGDFNDWDENSIPMKKLKSGNFTVTLDLEVGRDYQFRYLAGSDSWFNDNDPDRTEMTHYGDAENSVVSV
ncbi:isoamylase early set domain-containing protein [Maridesulfovibrio hydrothermalis]|uniref:Glycoside hydrolase family 13 domain protein n=1 Tax=Maridesulfovibrio hydrothermalis AM13 = DSM 14728 TaxID=1121451 RepID=L0RDL9_9BACT|nr:isoamylase early set domain-containing protein [Maridesulfovibrio hydrothermalis]CCO24844.1 Glycoside hydrolase family 13 domain protein [Maridesulfovibrio hydrothermalis AM13 = DSM 14728]